MTRTVRLRELLVGVEGLALLRHLYDGDDTDADARLAEVRRLLDDEAVAGGEATAESDVVTGYDAWAERYDEPGNLLIGIEEPVVWSLLERRKPGPALDAACGTGRHTRRLVELGHDVVGVDLSPGMLRVARQAVPAARFLEGDLRALPLGDARVDLVVCGLALAHPPSLVEPMAEIGRVLRPGGHAVLSVLHPFQAHLGWHAPFSGADGARGFVREHSHTHADYLAAFRAAGLRVDDCVEPELTAADVAHKRRAFRHIPEATLAAYVGLPAALVWDVVKE
ncbi:MAG TPA: class I SAM-dependent methyltransferase [Acidimicrobiales bacterium]